MTRIEENSVDIEKWIKLIRADGVGPMSFAKLLKRFGSTDRVLGASVSELTKTEGIGFKTAERITATRDKFDSSKELELAQKLGVWIINFDDNRYPGALKQINDPPPVLYVKGSLARQDNLAISIVGSRQCSLYGQEQSSRFAHLLSSSGFTICSGMARGIDTAAHQGALSASGRTIAVQGCGLSHIFPPENKRLFQLISESGACISELPLGFEPLATNFPARNRIIAGLSLGTIVIEAAPRSGALITANAAIDYNREVMAVPGKIDSPLSKGAHQLIKQGAKLIESVEDIMDALGYYGEQLSEHVTIASKKANDAIEQPLFDIEQLNLNKDEKTILTCLDKEPTHIEQIISQTSLTAGSVNAALISLRLKSLIKQLPGSLFIKR
ncbi:MAG: DNA-processing protein DprA [Sedimentisphaerales bacterium]